MKCATCEGTGRDTEHPAFGESASEVFPCEDCDGRGRVPDIDSRASWVEGYAAALKYCANEESRMFWGWNETPYLAATEAWSQLKHTQEEA